MEDNSKTPAPAGTYQAINAPPSTPLESPPKNRKKLLLVSAICAGILLIGGGVFAWLYLSKDQKIAHPATNVISGAGQTTDFKVAPRFNEVHGYASFKGADWYAADGAVIRIAQNAKPVYYMQREGVPLGVPSSLAVHNEVLWMSSQNGVATLKADESGFEAVKVAGGLSNGELYHDPYSNKLYLNSFDKLYVYDDDVETWVAQAGPANLFSFAAGKDFLVASANGLDMPVWVYTKATAKWALQKPSGIDNGTPQMIFAIGDQVFAMGRTTGYQSCEQAGKIVASSVYHLNQAGKWEALTDFNKDVARPELVVARHIKDSSTAFYTSNCSADQTPKKYTVTFTGNNLTLEEIKGTPDWASGFMGDDGEQQVIVNELSQATGLYPFIRVLASDKSGNLIFAYSTKADRSSTPTPEGIAFAKSTDLTQTTSLKLPSDERYDVQTPVMCDGTLSYLFVGVYAHEMREGFANGQWAKTQLLKVNGTEIEPFADLQNNVSEPTFACGGEKISWMGKSAAQQLTIATKKIVSAGSGLPATTAQQAQSVQPLENGDFWMLLSTDPSKEAKQANLYYFTSSTPDLKQVGTFEAVALLGGSTTHAWLAEGYGDNSDTFSGVTVYYTGGAKDHQAIDFLRLGLIDSTTAFIAQAETKTDSIFIPFKMIRHPLNGAETAVSPANVPVRELRLNTMPDETGAKNNNSGVFDPSHNRMWFSDDQLGSFSVDL